jgi:ADP-dependent NAD(P)H-hydrate dehydratase / NAD(P)H-hydrate epimerase
MKVFSTAQIRELDACTIRREPIASVDLMERAATGCSDWIARHITPDTELVFFTGPGNNGGDGWAIARQLVSRGFGKVSLYFLDGNTLSPDASMNRKRLEEQGRAGIFPLASAGDFPLLQKNTVIVDALFGSGLKGPLQGLSAALAEHINSQACRVVSIDIPSGLHGDDNEGFEGAVRIRAAHTLTFEFPKRSFFYPENQEYTGKWHVIPIGIHAGCMAETDSPFQFLTADDMAGRLPRRALFSHKGSFGHALLVAGSRGMLGAAIMAARACLRSGAGLLTTHLPEAGYPIVQGAVSESLFSLDTCESHWTEWPGNPKFSAVGIGPGIGTHADTLHALEAALNQVTVPLVLDADALNLLAAHPALWHRVPKNTILTPHPGEFDRLAGRCANGQSRNQRQIGLAVEKGLVIVLKGACTAVAGPDGSCTYNSTGNPGMATGGSGDVLTGVILALLAQGYPPAEAARIGVYIHGLAGDLAAEEMGYQALIASDLIGYLGKAFKTTEPYDTQI